MSQVVFYPWDTVFPEWGLAFNDMLIDALRGLQKENLVVTGFDYDSAMCTATFILEQWMAKTELANFPIEVVQGSHGTAFRVMGDVDEWSGIASRLGLDISDLQTWSRAGVLTSLIETYLGPDLYNNSLAALESLDFSRYVDSIFVYR